MCLEHVYSPFKAFFYRTFLRFRPYAYKFVYVEEIKEEMQLANGVERVTTSMQCFPPYQSHLGNAYDKTLWINESEYRSPFKGGGVPFILSDDVKSYLTGFHTYLTKKGACLWKTSKHLLVRYALIKVKICGVRAVGKQRGTVIVVEAMKLGKVMNEW